LTHDNATKSDAEDSATSSGEKFVFVEEVGVTSFLAFFVGLGEDEEGKENNSSSSLSIVYGFFFEPKEDVMVKRLLSTEREKIRKVSKKNEQILFIPRANIQILNSTSIYRSSDSMKITV
jgi:hypothetical protein